MNDCTCPRNHLLGALGFVVSVSACGQTDETEALSQRWFDQESGRYERPEPSEGVATGLRRFHGYR